MNVQERVRHGELRSCASDRNITLTLLIREKI